RGKIEQPPSLEGPAGLGAASQAQQRLQGPRNTLKRRQSPSPRGLAFFMGEWNCQQSLLY
uniref:hypothetical protein n=1 Tax=Pseudomonas sp. KCJK8993 TaxID=3344565 RepID=UPI003906B506